MSLTYEQAYDEMAQIFRDLFDDADGIFWEGVPEDRGSDAEVPFFYYSVRHSSGFQASMGAATGSRMFRRTGNITIQIFTQSGKGLSESQQLAKMISDAYEGKSSPGGVWFRNVRINEIGRDGAFFQTNVIVGFEYDEVK